VFKIDYYNLLMKDRDQRKKIYAEIKTCRTYYNNSAKKKTGKPYAFDDKVLRSYQKQYLRENSGLNLALQNQNSTPAQKRSNSSLIILKNIVFSFSYRVRSR
jgi:hypothetical protein